MAYVLWKKKERSFKETEKLLEPFSIKKFYTDDWGAYDRYLDENTHIDGSWKELEKRTSRKLNVKASISEPGSSI